MYLKTSFKRFLMVAFLALVALVVVGCVNNDEAVELAEKIYLPDADAIKGTFPLPKYAIGNKEAKITWESDNPAIISIGEFPDWDKSFNSELNYKATVVLPTDAETVVTLTATLQYGKQKAVKEIELSVVKNDYVKKTIAEAKQAKLADKIEITGVVIFSGEGGYVVKDATGQMYVYGGKGVKVGDKMQVRGTKDVYNRNPQVKFDSHEQLGTEAFDQEAEAEEMAVKDIPLHDNTDLAFYAKLVKVSGIVQNNTDSNVPYKIVNPLNPSEFVTVNKYSSTKSLKSLKDNLGKYIEVIGFVYDNRGDKFNLAIQDEFTGTTYTYTDQEVADVAVLGLQDKYAGQIVTGDLTLEKTANGAAITWASGNTDIVGNDGKVNLPDTDTKVTLTITATYNDKTATGTVEITVKKMPPVKINTLIDITPAKANDPKVLVVVEGVVIGHQYKGYWVADETGAILVYTNATPTTEKPFPTIGSYLSVKGELTTYKENQYFTSQIAPIDVKVLTGTAPTPIAPVELTFDQIFGLGIDTYAKAKTAAKTYFGRLITITGKVVQPSSNENYWNIVSLDDPTKFIYMSNLDSNAAIKLVKDKTVTITVIIREIFYIDDSSTYHNFYKNTFGGGYFDGNGVIVPQVAE